MSKQLGVIWGYLSHYKYLIVIVVGVLVVGAIDDNSIYQHVKYQIQINNLRSEIKKYTARYQADTKLLREMRVDPKAYQKIARELGIIQLSKPDEPLRYARHPLVYLVEAADDICYQMMDIEDAHKLKLLTHDETKGLYMLFFDEKRKKRIEEVCRIVTDVNEQIAYLRSSVIGALIKECTRVFTENEKKILAGEFEGALIKHICSPLKEAYENCSAIALQRIYRSSDVLDIELAGFRVISTLIDLMINAVRSPEKAYSQLLINRVSGQYNVNAPTLYGKIQAVLDYISGMTDVYALDLYRKIKGNSLPAV